MAVVAAADDGLVVRSCVYVDSHIVVVAAAADWLVCNCAIQHVTARSHS